MPLVLENKKQIVVVPKREKEVKMEKVLPSYTVVLLSIPAVRYEFLNNLTYLVEKYHICESESELLYDWLVDRATRIVLNNDHAIHDKDAYKVNDLYRYVFDDSGMGEYTKSVIRGQIYMNNLTFLRTESIKIMVTGDTLIISKGVILR